MTDWSVAKKGTFLMPSGSTDHLHFICSDSIFYPGLGKECVLVVNISSIKPDIGYDASCILNIGDHPFVTKPSYVYYLKADILGAENIERNVADGFFSAHIDCNRATFARIMDGFDISDEIRPKPYRFYEKYCK